MAAIGSRSAKNSPNPTTTPAAAATVDSSADSAEICRVAPTSRSAANRCSRRVADSLVAVPMKISTGASSARAITDRMRSMLDAEMPKWPAQLLLQLKRGVVLNAVTLVAPGVPDSCAGAWPMTISRMPGAGRPAWPMTPACVPG
jgi:hypothetical protein